MANDIMVVIGFVGVWIAICKMWNLYAMKRYVRSKKNSPNLTYGFYVGSDDKLRIVGAGSDGNSDYDVALAIKKVELPDDLGIKVDE